VIVKTERAKVHEHSLQRELSGLFPGGYYVITPEIHDNGHRHVYRAQHPPLADPQWSAIVGDCIHNLRSALDHLAFQLVRLSGREPTTKTQFPIHDHRPRGKWFSHKERLPDIRPGVTREIREVLEVVQRYGRQDPPAGLRLLKDLDNLDKHRELVVVVGAVGSHFTTWESIPGVGPPQSETEWTQRPLVHDEVVAIVTYPESRLQPDPNLKFIPHIAFSERAPKQIAKKGVALILNDSIFGLEDKVLPQFRKFFPKAT